MQNDKFTCLFCWSAAYILQRYCKIAELQNSWCFKAKNKINSFSCFMKMFIWCVMCLIIKWIRYLLNICFYKLPAYLGRDTCVSRPCSVRITPEIRAYHERDTLGKNVCLEWSETAVKVAFSFNGCFLTKKALEQEAEWMFIPRCLCSRGFFMKRAY